MSRTEARHQSTSAGAHAEPTGHVGLRNALPPPQGRYGERDGAFKSDKACVSGM
jgi:hypothetical protein